MHRQEFEEKAKALTKDELFHLTIEANITTPEAMERQMELDPGRPDTGCIQCRIIARKMGFIKG